MNAPTLFDLDEPASPLSPWQAEQAARTDPPFQYHSETSVLAAHEIRPTADNLRRAVFAYILEYGPVTDQQISDGLDMDPSTQRPRRRELEQKGLIRLDGGTALTRSGRSAKTWVVA